MSSHDDANPARASFTTMEGSTADDWQIIATQFLPYAGALPDRILGHLRLLEGDCGGFAVDRLMHSLQTATRAHRDGRDEEYVVCALLHDIGDTLGSYNHADIAAAIVKPFVSEENHWMVEKHAIFQGYYFFHHIGGDRNVREQFRSHEWFGRTENLRSGRPRRCRRSRSIRPGSSRDTAGGSPPRSRTAARRRSRS